MNIIEHTGNRAVSYRNKQNTVWVKLHLTGPDTLPGTKGVQTDCSTFHAGRWALLWTPPQSCSNGQHYFFCLLFPVFRLLQEKTVQMPHSILQGEKYFSPPDHLTLIEDKIFSNSNSTMLPDLMDSLSPLGNL